MSVINKRIEVIRKKIDSTETDAISGVWYFYRPQTKFAKVMFSQVSVCPGGEVGGGVFAPLHAGTPPSGQTPPGRHPPLCSACWNTVNKRPVRIPLECILVVDASNGFCFVLNMVLHEFVILTYTKN